MECRRTSPIRSRRGYSQLAYVALHMMSQGIQRIAYDDLQRQIQDARKYMPELLGFARMSVADFISTVELRSSLLLQSGHELRDGTIQRIFEFRHLLFQEYLAAKAITESYLSDGQNKQAHNIAPLSKNSILGPGYPPHGLTRRPSLGEADD